jgi:hypothetical protein
LEARRRLLTVVLIVFWHETTNTESKMSNKPTNRFPLGQIVATPGAIQAMQDAGQTASVFLSRHAACDWGAICQQDKSLNDEAVDGEARILSAYTTSKGVRLWIITEVDRSVTTILLPEEY